MRSSSILAVSLVVTCVVATSAARAQRRASRAALYTSDLFQDDALWAATVREERPEATEDDPVRAPELVASAEVSASLAPLERLSIDQEVLRELILDRSRQVAMRAVADALRGIGGPLADRQYVRDIVEQASRLIVDDTGLSNTLVEALVATLVRGLVSDALVSVRFGGEGVTDACRWRTRVYGAPAPGGGESCADAPMPRLRATCGGDEDDASPRCALLATGPWMPAEGDPEARQRLRGYLVDVTYWSLGRTPLFARPGSAPPCPFEEDEDGRALCGFFDGADTDTERARRVDWLIGYGDLTEVIRTAQQIMGALEGPQHVQLGRVLDALVAHPQLGSLGGRGPLDARRWQHFAQIGIWADAWVKVIEVARAAGILGPGRSDSTLLQRRLSELEAILVDPCAEPIMSERFGRGLPLIDFCAEPEDPPPRDEACDGVPTSILGWARDAQRRASLIASGDDPRERADRLCAPQQVRGMLDRLMRSAGRADELGTTLQRVSRVAREMRVEVDGYADWLRRRAGSDGSLEISEMRLSDLTRAVGYLREIGAAFEVVEEEVRHGEVWALVRLAPRQDVWLRVFTQYGGYAESVGRMLGLFALVDVDDAGGGRRRRLGEVTQQLRTAAPPLIERLGPVVSYLRTDRRLTIETMLYLLDRMDPAQIVVALGLAEEPAAFCADDEGSLACWVHRIVLVLAEATDVREDQVRVDPNRIVNTLAAMGADFRRRRDWRWYFHLTIGIGGMVSYLPSEVTGTGDGELRVVPLMAEQIGIGYASPTFADDRLTFKAGLFGSGLLYRVVLDSEESEAFFFGGFLALELYQLLELYAAPFVSIFPPTDTQPDVEVGWGLSFGAQVPLGDYLEQL